jgi:hypothetical protein
MVFLVHFSGGPSSASGLTVLIQLSFSPTSYLGRGASFPLALEGALKLKEISYIHAEG